MLSTSEVLAQIVVIVNKLIAVNAIFLAFNLSIVVLISAARKS